MNQCSILPLVEFYSINTLSMTPDFHFEVTSIAKTNACGIKNNLILGCASTKYVIILSLITYSAIKTA